MTNVIERTTGINAPIERVWQALTDYKEFGSWFRVDLHGPFMLDQITTGKVTYPGYEGLQFWALVKTIEKLKHFSFVWPMDENVQPDDPDIQNKSTLVEFSLEPNGDGTTLTVRESGFDNLPGHKRMQVFRDNQGGWDAQMKNIVSHVR